MKNSTEIREKTRVPTFITVIYLFISLLLFNIVLEVLAVAIRKKKKKKKKEERKKEMEPSLEKKK